MAPPTPAKFYLAASTNNRKYKITKPKKVGPLPQLLLVVCLMSTFTLLLQHNQTLVNPPFLRNLEGNYVSRQWPGPPPPLPPSNMTSSNKIKSCSPARRVVFLKTHKTASSTVQNILLRYALKNNLSVVLPMKGVYLDKGDLEGIPVENLKKSPFAPPLGKYYFFIHHARLNVHDIMELTYPDAKWITIVRDPAASFESLYTYYFLEKRYKVTFDTFVHRLTPFSFNQDIRFYHRIGKNQVAFDFGLREEDLKDPALQDGVIKVLDNVFHLVMIAEHMDESLILLKHLMCWTDDDILALSKNVRSSKFKRKLTSLDKTKLRNFNYADKKIYQHFKEKFHRLIDKFGRDRMSEEVENLRAKRRKVLSGCQLSIKKTHTDISKRDPTFADVDPMLVQYNFNASYNRSKNRLCEELITKNTDFNDKLRNKQYRRYQNLDVDWTPLYKDDNIKKKKKKKKEKPKKKKKKSPKKKD